MKHYIYQTTNNINDKIYVGRHSTIDMNDGYLGSGTYLWNAIKKYGKENFSKEILYFAEDFEELCEIEEVLVNEEFINRKDTYNLRCGGRDSGLCSEEVKEKIRKTLKGQKYSKERRYNMSQAMLGKKRGSHSEETKQKMRCSMLSRTKIECPYCGLKCAPHTASRWHFGNCKHA